MLRYLGRPAPETVLVLVQGAGEESGGQGDRPRSSSAVALEPLPAERVRKWLQRRATRTGASAERGRRRSTCWRAVGGELAPLAAELEKLAALPPGEPLTAERVGELVGVRHGETVFDWRDAVMDDRTGPAVALLGQLLDQPGNSGVKLVTLLGTTLVGVGVARTHYDRGSGAGRWTTPSFELIRRCRVFGLLELGRGEDPLGPLGFALAGGAGDRRPFGRRWTPTGRSRARRISDERGILATLVLRLGTAKREAA